MNDHSPLEAIFFAALEKGSPQERAAYLDEASAGNPDLRRRVEKMLAAQAQAGSFLEQPACSPVMTVDDPITERPGTLVGPYKLLQQIGEGGFGVVFMAEQEHPVRRKVALKVIKPGMDTRQVIARFEAERQALAMMDHVNIARVLDVGTTESGRPYFVMELVHGVPITKYCDDNHLTPRQRLELFVPVCQAIQHAHQKGIIHRDVKPSNVMITLYDGKPVPKVIDFGVAKATEQKLTEHTLFTQYGTMVGTFEYMSPEQAEMSGLGADTRSDIYSLGVLLYELLTGSTPLTHRRIKEAAYGEILRMIKEEEPPKPSTRLSDSGETLASISAQRRTEPAKLANLMRGELDWIVMKCLEKDRNRRYDTASAFAADVQRYLNDEAVQACPPSAGYRFRKFARRNRAGILTAAVIVATLVLGTVVSAWQAVRATRANDLADTRLEAEKQAHGGAIANLQKARDAVDQMLTRVAEERLANVPQMEPVRKALFEDALKFYQGFLDQKNSDPALRLETGRAWSRIGQIHKYLSAYVPAEKGFRESIAIFEKLVEDFPSDASYQAALADSYFKMGEMLSVHLGRNEEAEKALRHSLALRENLTDDDTAAPGSRSAIASNTIVGGDYVNYDTAVPGSRSAIASIQITLGNSLMAAGRTREAEQACRRGVALAEKLAGDFPTVAHYRGQLADSYYWLGCVLAGTNRPQETEQAYRQALAIAKKLLAENPSSDHYRHRLSGCQLRLGDLLMETNRPQEAEAAIHEGLAVNEKLTTEFPNVPAFRAQQGGGELQLGNLLAANKRPQEAEQAYRRALTILEKVVVEGPGMPYWRSMLFDCQDRLVKLLKDGGRIPEAEQICRQAVASFEKLVARSPDVPDYRRELAERHQALSDFLLVAGRAQEAKHAYHQVLQIREKLILDFPDKSEYRQQLVDCYLELGNRLRVIGQPQEAEKTFRQAIEFCAKLAAEFPTIPEYRFQLAHGQEALSHLLWIKPPHQEGVKLLREAMKGYEKLAADFPDVPRYQTNELYAHLNLGLILEHLHQPREAEQEWRLGVALSERMTADAFPGDRLTQQAVCLFHVESLLRASGWTQEADTTNEKVQSLLDKLHADFPAGEYRNHLVGNYFQHAALLNATGRPQEAEKAYRKIIELNPNSTILLNDPAWQLDTSPDAIHQLYNSHAWRLATCPDIRGPSTYWSGHLPHFRNPSLAVELAKKAVELAPKEWAIWNTLGVAHYRAGDCKAAIAALEKSMELRKGGDSIDWFFLAMARWQLGEKKEAREWYDKAVGWMEKNKEKLEKNKQLDEELRRFRAEAAALLGVNEKSTNPKDTKDTK